MLEVHVTIVMDALAVRLQDLLRAIAHRALDDAERLVGLAPARSRATVEDRNPRQLAHRGHAHDADLARLARGPEAVIFVKLAGRDVEISTGRHGRAAGARQRTGRGPCPDGRRAKREPSADSAGQRRAAGRRAKQGATVQPLAFLLLHDRNSFLHRFTKLVFPARTLHSDAISGPGRAWAPHWPRASDGVSSS